jgi:MFS transporter, ACS family, tartrate transporter
MSVIEPVPLVHAMDVAHSVGDSVGRSALRKASVHLLPLIALGYCISYIDRANIGFASLQMNHDLHFSASIYGLGAGLFFLSYAACELPSNLMLVRFGARRWIARIMFTWGLLAIGMMFVKTPMQFYCMRLLLGAAEAGFFPGVVFYLMQWFPPRMRARTVGRLYVAIPLSSVLMGIIAGALLGLQGRLGLAGWQWLFLVEGLPAVLVSVVFWFYLPDTPAEAKWLTAQEREWIHAQVQVDNAGGEAVHREGISCALLDPRVWMLGLFYSCILGAGYSYAFYAPNIVQKLTGFSATNVGFVIASISLVNAGCVVLISLHSDRTYERFLHLVIPCLLMAAGFILGGLSTAPLIAIPALGLSIIGQTAVQPIMWSLPSSFLKNRAAAAGIAAISSMGILGAFFGPVCMGWMRDFTGNYQLGIVALAIPSFLAAVIIFSLRHTGSNVLTR